MLSNESAQLATARSQTYHFLARFFTHAPDGDFVARVLSDETLASLEELFAPEAVQPLRSFGAQYGGTFSLRDLVTDHAGLFDVPAEQYLAPYESVYRQDSVDDMGQPRAFVRGPSTVEVERLYAEAGAEITPEFRDLPDHIGMELEFMAFLCDRESEAWQVGEAEDATEWRDWQRRFLEEHLGVWIGALCEKMKSQARTDFFRTAAGLTTAYTAQERDLLGKEGE